MKNREELSSPRFEFIFVALLVVGAEYFFKAGLYALLTIGVLELVHIRAILQATKADADRASLLRSRRIS